MWRQLALSLSKGGNVGIHLHIFKSAYFQIYLIACPAVAEPVEAPKGEDAAAKLQSDHFAVFVRSTFKTHALF